MNIGIKLKDQQKENLAQIIGLVLTTIIILTITLGIYKILNPKKTVEIVPHLHLKTALLHKDLKCKAPLIEPNLRRNLGKWST
ncbi:hypothetical protein AhaeAN59_04910 [Acinetobacter haemolyticus]|uniref:Uncharacterized protein n=2 Tax=Acinetobacter haemolyticus TaxID=29430 RepID=A0A857IID9_ACIHA|nr:hypothetical protein AhaeAN59_04910 [Acinetobacter haemolyticus]QHI12755.1 hypothetical protein AhaeAN43_04865 [Acinetobacter haemolyticus]